MSRNLREKKSYEIINCEEDSTDDDDFCEEIDSNPKVRQCNKEAEKSKNQDEIYVIDLTDNESNRKGVVGTKDAVVNSSIISEKTKNKRPNNKTHVDEEQTNLIVISDESDKDIKPEKSIGIKRRKQTELNEVIAAKKVRTVRASTSKKKVALNKELSKTKAENKDAKENKNDNFNDVEAPVEWSEPDYLKEFHQIDEKIAENIISLFKDDNTIPFIARYRKEMTGGMEPEELRSIKNTYDNLKLIKQRAMTILKSMDKLGKWSPELYSAVTAAKSMDELEHIYAPHKPGSKRSLAERAKELGLASVCEAILQGQRVPSLSTFVDVNKEGLKNEDEVKQGIVHIIADMVSKDKVTFEGIRELRKTAFINIETTKSRSANLSKMKDSDKHKSNDMHKYENYFNFTSSEKFIKDYQILAINRGESQKIISVKIIIPDWFRNRLKEHCLRKYTFIRKISKFHSDIIDESFDDAYNRLIKNFICRQIRQDLNKKAETASIEVFANNLKKLLLIPPLRGKTILGIDPGFSHGCKLAAVSQCGNVLDTATIYPHTSSKSIRNQHVQVLVNLVKKHGCTILALGNATACRETETFITDLIQAGEFAPLDVSYTIVNEAGASIYSCGSEAKAEFPDLDPNIISAISIARRLQDPLAELVKVEPKHLGIGMYQHDLPEKQLQLTLGEVITETVSFVGVDVNTASHCLLRRVAGLNANRATNIIEHRKKYGPFLNRQQLLEVKGIGKKSFEQCAGFIRILPETALSDNKSELKKYCLDYLDQTWIHPESYNIAKKFLEVCKCDLNELGSEKVIGKVTSYSKEDLKILAKQFETNETSMDIIINGLSMRKGEDIRVKEEAPLFRKNLRCIDDLCVNTKLSGSVRNVTNFGAFVDIGVGRDGLIPISKMKGQVLSLGQRVEVLVFSIEKERNRIVLTL